MSLTPVRLACIYRGCWSWRQVSISRSAESDRQHSTAEATRSQRTYLMENNRSNQQAPPPPPGYPTAAAEQGQAGGKKGGRASTKSRGEKGFIEGWYVLPTTSYSIHRHHLLNCRL
uniref:Uncharacterized protein n=1 Tax=Triticum urartu TaxID=4572 RepID=A0A8R7Q0A8_TRIUA